MVDTAASFQTPSTAADSLKVYNDTLCMAGSGLITPQYVSLL